MKELTLQDSVIKGRPDFSFMHLAHDETSTDRAQRSSCIAHTFGAEAEAGRIRIVSVTSVTKAEAEAASVGLDPVLDLALSPGFFAAHLATRIDDDSAVTVHIIDEAFEYDEYWPAHTVSRAAQAFAVAARAEDPACIILTIGHIEALEASDLDGVIAWMSRGFLAPDEHKLLLEFDPQHLVR